MPTAPATGPRSFFSGEGGPVVLVEDTMVTMGGKKMRRRVYSLEKDLTQRFLPTRELSKVPPCGCASVRALANDHWPQTKVVLRAAF